VVDAAEQQRLFKRYLDLLPLTLSLAGLPHSESGKYYTEEQIESRKFTMRYAQAAAEQLLNSIDSGRHREFFSLLPSILALAGLPHSEAGRYYTEDQIESRVFPVKHAYKAARQLARESVQS